MDHMNTADICYSYFLLAQKTWSLLVYQTNQHTCNVVILMHIKLYKFKKKKKIQQYVSHTRHLYPN